MQSIEFEAIIQFELKWFQSNRYDDQPVELYPPAVQID